MGIENRDYMSGIPSNRGQDIRSWSAVTTLIVLNVVVFILQILSRGLLQSWFELAPYAVLHGQIWRLTTYDFLHDTLTSFPWHLLFNMWLLWLAGNHVEQALGKREFIAFYLLAGVLSGITFMAWGLARGSETPAIGASGAAVAVMIVYAVYWPNVQWSLWGIIPIPVYVLALFAAGMDIFPMLQEMGGIDNDDHVAHSAHIGGMAFGLLYAVNGWRITSWLPSPGRGRKFRSPFRRRPKLKVHVPDPEERLSDMSISASVETRLDELLEKISLHGEASLTAEERQFLADASRRYRNRRE